jgi:recombinational DNA repair protein RecR
MARKPLTDRQAQLQAAYKALEIEKAQLRTIRGRAAAQSRRVKAAQAAIDALGVCDQCGDRTYPTGAEPQLCQSCSDKRRRQSRIELLAAHGYGPDGKRLPKVTAA